MRTEPSRRLSYPPIGERTQMEFLGAWGRWPFLLLCSKGDELASAKGILIFNALSYGGI